MAATPPDKHTTAVNPDGEDATHNAGMVQLNDQHNSTHEEMANSNSEGSYFDWFALPQELRDEIYDYSLHEGVETRMKKDRGEQGITVLNTPNPVLLRLNRQCNYEYVERIKKSTVLRYEDDGFGVSRVQLHGIAREVQQVELHLATRAYRSAELEIDMASHATFASELSSQLRNAKLTVFIYVTESAHYSNRPLTIPYDTPWHIVWETTEIGTTCKHFVNKLQPVELSVITVGGWNAMEPYRTTKSRQLRERWASERGWESRS